MEQAASTNTNPAYHVSNHKLTPGVTGLWQAVILQAFIDAGTTRKRSQAMQRQAIEWLLCNYDDFFTVCSLANIDAIKLRQAALNYLQANCITTATL